MEITFPHSVVYETEGKVPIDEVIESLIANRRLINESLPLIEALLPDLKLEHLKISVGQISNQSPLRELVFVTLIAAFQDDLKKEVPMMINDLFGVQVSENYNTLVTVVVMLLVFYGIDFAYRMVSKTALASRARQELDGLIGDVAKQLGISEDSIRVALNQRYSRGKINRLARTAIQFIRPSKHQGNAPILIGQRTIDASVIAEAPSDVQLEEIDDEETSSQHPNVEIELHAQDKDKSKQGWAGVPVGISQDRIKMELYPPIKPEELWNKERIRGDIIVLSKKKNDKYIPYLFHVVRIHDEG